MAAHPPVPVPPASPPEPPLRVRLRANVAHSARAMGLVWGSAPAGVVALAFFTIVAAALPPLVAYVGKLIIDAVMAHDSARAVTLVALELGAVVALAGCERLLGLIRQLVGLRLGIDLNVRILEKARAARAAPVRGPRVLRQADPGPARGLDPPAVAHPEQLPGRPPRPDPGRLRRAAGPLLGLDGAGRADRDDPRLRRRGPLLRRGVPAAQLALPRFAPPDLPRVRPRPTTSTPRR